MPRKAKLFGGLGLLTSLAFLGAVGAWACVPGARITLSPTSGGPGTSVTVTGTTFDPAGSPVKIYWGGTSGTLLGQVAVQPDRSFRFTFRVPDRASGTNVVSATQLDSQGRGYNPVNATFNAGGTRQPNPSNVQGAPVPSQPDGSSAPQPAPQPRQAARAGAPAASPAPAQAGSAAPAQAGSPAGSAATAPGTATAGSPAGAAAGAPATAGAAQPGAAAAGQAAPQVSAQAEPFQTPAPAPEAAAVAAEPSSSRAPLWLLVPLALLALGFLATGTGIFLADRKRVRAQA